MLMNYTIVAENPESTVVSELLLNCIPACRAFTQLVAGRVEILSTAFAPRR